MWMRFTEPSRGSLVTLAASLLAFVSLSFGVATARPLITGVAGTTTGAVATAEGVVFFAPQTQQEWGEATGVDPAVTYTAVLSASDGFYILLGEDGSVWRSTSTAGNAFVQRRDPGGPALRAITQIGAQLLVVGDAGTILRSADLTGASWVSVASPTTANLRGVATNSITSTVAVGEGGTVIRGGINGNAWGSVTLAESNTFHAVISEPVGGNFLAVGEFGAAWSSLPDGTTWSAVDTGEIGTHLRGAAQFGTATAVVGNEAEIYVAEQNFANWQLASTPADSDIGRYDLYAVAFTGPRLIAGGTRRTLLWSTTNGLVWDFGGVTPVLESSWGQLKQLFQPKNGTGAADDRPTGSER